MLEWVLRVIEAHSLAQPLSDLLLVLGGELIDLHTANVKSVSKLLPRGHQHSSSSASKAESRISLDTPISRDASSTVRLF